MKYAFIFATEVKRITHQLHMQNRNPLPGKFPTVLSVLNVDSYQMPVELMAYMLSGLSNH